MLSIVIPVFNGMPYLPDLFERLRSQTLQEFEVIFVDDGSMDGSGDYIRNKISNGRYLGKYFYYSQSNQGAGAARNFGFQHTRGDYVWFLDCDDIISESFVERMYLTAKQNDSDVVVCLCQDYDNRSQEIKQNTYSVRKDLIPKKLPCDVSSSEIEHDFFHSFVWWPWDKIFKKSHIIKNKISFDTLSSTNDLYFVCLAIMLSDKISILDEILISHRINIPHSVSNVRYRSPLDCLTALDHIRKKMEKDKIWEKRKVDFINYFLAFVHWHLITLPSKGRISLFYNTHIYYKSMKKDINDQIKFYYPGLNYVSQFLINPTIKDYLKVYNGSALILHELNKTEKNYNKS